MLQHGLYHMGLQEHHTNGQKSNRFHSNLEMATFTTSNLNHHSMLLNKLGQTTRFHQ